MSQWLSRIFVEAKENKWCTKPYCTTCGSREFWIAVYDSALASANLEAPVHEGLKTLRAFSALAEALRYITLEEMSANIDAVRTILIHANALGTMKLVCEFPVHAISDVTGAEMLCESLYGCPVGDELKRMCDHTQSLAERGFMRAKFEREAPLREEAARAAAIQKIQERKGRKSKRDARRMEILQLLAQLTDIERLRLLAGGKAGVPLGAIPQSLVPSDGFASLSTTQQEYLRLKTARLKAWRPLFR